MHKNGPQGVNDGKNQMHNFNAHIFIIKSFSDSPVIFFFPPFIVRGPKMKTMWNDLCLNS